MRFSKPIFRQLQVHFLWAFGKNKTKQKRPSYSIWLYQSPPPKKKQAESGKVSDYLPPFDPSMCLRGKWSPILDNGITASLAGEVPNIKRCQLHHWVCFDAAQVWAMIHFTQLHGANTRLPTPTDWISVFVKGLYLVDGSAKANFDSFFFFFFALSQFPGPHPAPAFCSGYRWITRKTESVTSTNMHGTNNWGQQGYLFLRKWDMHLKTMKYIFRHKILLCLQMFWSQGQE